ncbi:two-component regulator propeller domain-containing protein [Mariniflexile ostreae]|uniref:histidine kinase n=1 Tax=Mariniflexile ostreae TaxID=1520892 RepID=A0ABV5FD09_9FLAO
MKIRKTLFLFFFGLFINIVNSQYSNLKFEHLDASEGLSNNSCVEIFQDSKGFLWFGTNDGLNRYDGYQFKIYRPFLNNPNSISNSRINTIQEDRQHNLWIGTDDGLNVFDSSREVFFRVPIFKKENSKDVINALLFDDHTNSLWVATNNGLVKIFLEDTKAVETYSNLEMQHYLNIYGNENSISNNNITKIIQDAKHQIWFVTNDDHLNRYDSKTNQFERVLINIPSPKKFDHISKSVIIDKDGDFWMGNNLSYLIFWDRKTNTFESISPVKKDITIFDIYQDSNGIIWIATDGSGLYLINKDTKKATHIEHNPLNPFSLPNNQPSKILEDNKGLFWVGSYNKGVSKLVLSKSAFGHYFYQPGKTDGLSAKIAQAVLEDRKKRIWIGTGTGGLNLFNEQENKFTHYRSSPNRINTLSSDKILSLSESYDGSIWVGTWDGGLNKFNPETETFKRYLHDEDDSFSLSQNTVWATVEDSEKRLWIGTTAGLNVYQPHSDRFSNFKNRTGFINSIPSNFIFSLFIDSKNRLLVGTALGLAYVNLSDLKDEVPHNLQFNKILETSIANIRINYITEDSQGDFWVGTDLGLYQLNANFKLLKIYSTENGLPNNIVIGIAEGDNGRLWITTKSGVSVLNPVHNSFINYNTNDGLQGEEFQSKAIEKTQDGRLIMGGINGFNLFNPKHIFAAQHVAQPEITTLKIFNKTVKAGDTINNRVLFETNISEVKTLELKHNEGFLTFEFVALNYQNPEQTKYAYKLDGLEEDFIIAENDRNVNYSNLSPGHYTFMVKSTTQANWDGSQIAKINIKINPPFWKTWWAYTAYVLIGILLLWVIVYVYTKQVKEDQEHELDQLKLQFFINVSHEFRTPLTLILNPVDKILSNLADTDAVKSSALSIQRSSRRLLYLINQLLDYRKMDVGMSPLQLKKHDIITYTKDIFLLFSELSTQKNITYTFKTNSEQLIGFFDYDKIEKIVTNLISNALKFTEPGGKIKVSVNKVSEYKRQSRFFFNKKEESIDYVQIIVKDTGIGMKKQQIKKIFTRFYNVDVNKTGTGIGLDFTKALVEMHGGEIYAESVYKKGSEFVVKLPLIQKGELTEVSHVKDEFLINTIKSLEYDMLTTSDATTESSPTEKTGLKTVLLVEDNKELRTHLKTHLSPLYKVKEAANGKEGLKMVKKHFPDIVVSDIMMPKMDGFELCRLLKSDLDTSHIPIILLTARTLDEDKIEGFQIGADEYLSKPFSLNILTVRIKNLLQAKKTLQEKFSKLTALMPSDALTTNTLDEVFLEKATKIVLENIEDLDFSLEDMYEKMGIGRSQFFRKIQSLTGDNPTSFIRTIRLKYASQLLLKNEYAIKEIAYMSGFNSPTYFSKSFKKQFNQTPKAFIAEHLKVQQPD